MKRTKNILIILIIACMLFAGCAGKDGSTTTTQETSTTLYSNTASNPYEMGLVRNLQTEADAGTTFTVTLNLTFNGTKKPGLLGVTENYPSNWTATNITGGGILSKKTSTIEWLFFPPLYGQQAQNTTLSYQLTTPKDITGTYFFEGNATAGNQDTAITGRDSITIN